MKKVRKKKLMKKNKIFTGFLNFISMTKKPNGLSISYLIINSGMITKLFASK